jgi:hypothetical protein
MLLRGVQRATWHARAALTAAAARRHRDSTQWVPALAMGATVLGGGLLSSTECKPGLDAKIDTEYKYIIVGGGVLST